MRNAVGPPSLLVLARRQGELLSGEQCDEAGVLRDRRARLVRDGTWSHPTRGVFDVAPASDRRGDAAERRRRAAWLGMLAYGHDAVAVGPCALTLHGVSGLPRDIQPEVALLGGRSVRPRDGIRVRYLDRFDTLRFGSGRIAALGPALVQALPDLPRDHAVAVLDDVLRRGWMSDRDLSQVRASLLGRRGSAKVRDWFGLVDRRAESPLETFARLECVDAGVAPDELQVEIRDHRGSFVARGDLGWRLAEGRWLIAEIDGREFHEAPDALLRDRRRQNAMLATGRVDLLRFTSNDIARRGTISAAVTQALAGVATLSSRAPNGPLARVTTSSLG